jgi:hypothetical protein
MLCKTFTSFAVADACYIEMGAQAPTSKGKKNYNNTIMSIYYKQILIIYLF